MTLVKVKTHFDKEQTEGYVERQFNTNKSIEEMFALANCMISKDDPRVQLTNFSSKPIKLQAGRIIGFLHNPSTSLLSSDDLSQEELRKVMAHTNLIKTLIKEKPIEPPVEYKEELAQPVEGGPKISELPDPDPIPSERLLDELHFSEALKADQRKVLEDIVLQHKNAFGLDGRLGSYDAKIEIELRPGTKEISLPPYHASPEKREAIDKQIKAWLELGVIEPAESAWGFPVIVVYSKGKPRLCVDYRQLNKVIVPDQFPLPRQVDILHSLQGAQYLTTLDALAGFTQLSIKEEDRDITAFRCHAGSFRFNRMPFGIIFGPSKFQREIGKVLAGKLWKGVLAYIDDIVVYGKSFEEHNRLLDWTLNAIEKSGLTLSPNKCHIGYESLLLLGQKVSRLGMSTHKEKVEAIQDLDPPKNTKGLQTFLGMMTYFSSYIPFYAWITAPLFKLLRKDTTWNWTELEQKAFELAKEALASAPVLAFPITDKPFRLYTDACDFGLAAILQQVQQIKVKDLKGTRLYAQLETAHTQGNPVPSLVKLVSKEEVEMTGGNNGVKVQDWDQDNWENTLVYVERVVAYWSRILKPAERNYSATERECLALKEGLVKFQNYLEGATFTAITDHSALTWSTTFQHVNRRLNKWGTVLAAYPGMKIIHRQGRVHDNADSLSRMLFRTPKQDSPLPDTSKPLLLNAEDMNHQAFEKKGKEFIKKLEAVTNAYAITELDSLPCQETYQVQVELHNNEVTYETVDMFNLLVSIHPDEIEKYQRAYLEDSHYKKVLSDLQEESDPLKTEWPHYSIGDNGLIYFIDHNENMRLCVPKPLHIEVIKEAHDLLNEGAHAGRDRTYNRIAANYYWKDMAKDVKQFTP
ncbi:Transposon Ty3-I Gag-Pol polyprotein OS=Saccharomyces cerevisiae (strain ATCC 204508 / S288c) GN=TY3B-I PE=3 SV=2 [Rhizoctonia solani AG-1 IB]|uniref:Transposon Ty3-I Gag-Pol polyprotein n=1 Tax=Thanatephorus cucumeris (strain AG1-IB / isolate 7/3/14) TaxID=1108050 RepID=A0A0B7FGV3_THACB|nr:Transposon Ty3-I Gag-Pol polyprotein OS=Saccharomyces cerevisiae (strain ATCC 204508 / S288c) GN=TY3B-I PE=3 SV=2 [Rhizoctonia solani AG-1 IB]